MPRIVIATGHYISIFDVDLNKTVQNVPARVHSALMAYTADSGMLYYIQDDILFAAKIIDGSKFQVLLFAFGCIETIQLIIASCTLCQYKLSLKVSKVFFFFFLIIPNLLFCRLFVMHICF